jgi:hypothetical protein
MMNKVFVLCQSKIAGCSENAKLEQVL